MKKTKREILEDALNGKINIKKIRDMEFTSISTIELSTSLSEVDRPLRIIINKSNGQSMSAWLPYKELHTIDKLCSNIISRGRIVFNGSEEQMVLNSRNEIELNNGVILPRWNNKFVADEIGGSLIFVNDKKSTNG